MVFDVWICEGPLWFCCFTFLKSVHLGYPQRQMASVCLETGTFVTMAQPQRQSAELWNVVIYLYLVSLLWSLSFGIMHLYGCSYHFNKHVRALYLVCVNIVLEHKSCSCCPDGVYWMDIPNMQASLLKPELPCLVGWWPKAWTNSSTRVFLSRIVLPPTTTPQPLHTHPSCICINSLHIYAEHSHMNICL